MGEKGKDEQTNEMMDRIVSQVAEFLETAAGRRFMYTRWLETERLRVYLRKSLRPLDGVDRQCLDIAAIEIADEYQQQGLFTTFVLKIHELHSWDATYIEHTQNSIVEHWCRKRGWECDPRSNPPSFYLLKKTARNGT